VNQRCALQGVVRTLPPLPQSSSRPVMSSPPGSWTSSATLSTPTTRIPVAKKLQTREPVCPLIGA
jgi:hypothetical protein